MLATVWLGVVLVGLAAWTVIDMRQYRAFTLVEDSAQRRGFYGRWTAQSFLILVGGSLITAAVLGRSLPFTATPPEFEQIADSLMPSAAGPSDGEGRLSQAIGFGLGVSIAITVGVWRMRRAMRAMLGDFDALIPRNGREMLAALPLCLNAGFSEELFFRLALPLLITAVTGSGVIGLGASTVIFGLVHAYQGWRGVIGTTLAGTVMTAIYLQSGSLLRPMMLHALIDIFTLIARPMLAARLSGSGRQH